jgi:hypothetical protein
MPWRTKPDPQAFQRLDLRPVVRRESAVANTLIEGLRARRQRYVAFQNHTKVMLLAAPPDYLVMEGSANFTANPRLEQTVFSNDRALFDFHRSWMESMLAADGGQR